MKCWCPLKSIHISESSIWRFKGECFVQNWDWALRYSGFPFCGRQLHEVKEVITEGGRKLHEWTLHDWHWRTYIRTSWHIKCHVNPPLLACYAVLTSKLLSMFQTIVQPPASGLRGLKTTLLGLRDPQNGGNMLLRNISNHLPINMV